jgi:hypothetical protein
LLPPRPRKWHDAETMTVPDGDEHGLSGCNGAGPKVPGSGSALVLVDDAAEDIVAADRPTMAGL